MDDIEIRIAERVRALRAARGWPLEELAQRSGVSRAMISRIERHESSPTAGLLARLADALGTTLSELMAEGAGARATVQRAERQLQWRDPETGYVRRMVSPPGAQGDTEIVAVELPAGARVPLDPLTGTRYEQQVLVLEGRLRLDLDGERVELAPGDCARMALDRPHAFENLADAPTRYLVVVRKTSPLSPPAAGPLR